MSMEAVVVDGADFVEMMNQHALDVGLTDTHFTSANGWDDPTNANPDSGDLNHYTTARELSETIHHGLECAPALRRGDRLSRDVHGHLPRRCQRHEDVLLELGLHLPRLGRAARAAAPRTATGCRTGSVSRSARRGSGDASSRPSCKAPGGNEITDMFDFGFGQIFHPDAVAPASAVGDALSTTISVCFSASRCLTAALPDSGPVELVSWAPDVDGSSIAILDQEPLPRLRPAAEGQGQRERTGRRRRAHKALFRRDHRRRPQGEQGGAVALVDGRGRSPLAARRWHEDRSCRDDGPAARLLGHVPHDGDRA